ncbi:MAG: LamG domain-containing protein, partial [Planctomycetaceae bacterium]|nr:LamG domain-containing protein [Planctomycetaceae bacterium]
MMPNRFALRLLMTKLSLFLCFAMIAPRLCMGQEATKQQTKTAKEPAEINRYDELILADEPVAYWNFSPKRSPENLPGSMRWLDSPLGKPLYKNQGPSSEDCPLITNSFPALTLDGKSALVIKDPGEDSVFDFTNGDTISVEAWVNCKKLGGGANVYIIGKGRTGNKGFAANNQNWAVRLKEEGGMGAISFLFRDERNRGNDSSDWHRWTSDSGVAPNSGWHHVAVTYTFGKPKTIRGWVDGYPTGGTWDMGKTTEVAPLVDNDEVRIGSSGSLASSNSFTGEIDSLALYRRPLTDAQIEKRCPPKPGAREIADDEIPAGRVLVQIHEGIPNVKHWKFRIPEATDS